MGTRKMLLGVLSSLLLVGCADGAPSTGPALSSTVSVPNDGATDDGTDGSGTTDTDPSDEPSSDSSSDPSASLDVDAEDGGGMGTDNDESALEIPEAAEEPVVRLSELLGAQLSAPLVAFPLPRAASASARLVTGFPSVLRPTGSSVVETSSLSPSGDRLQVGLVATTSRSPDQVLVGYRSRLSAHGLVERHAPPAMPGSTAATFRRGRSSVTLTVMPEGSRTTYVVQGSLYAGRG